METQFGRRQTESPFVTTSTGDVKHNADAPGVHVHLLLLGKLEGQGWAVCFKDGRIEPRD